MSFLMAGCHADLETMEVGKCYFIKPQPEKSFKVLGKYEYDTYRIRVFGDKDYVWKISKIIGYVELDCRAFEE